MKPFEKWRAYLARTELRLPFPTEIFADERGTHDVLLTVRIKVPCVDTREPIFVHTCRHLGDAFSEAYAKQVIRSLLRQAFEHELDEGIRIDGRNAFGDPHAGGATISADLGNT